MEAGIVWILIGLTIAVAIWVLRSVRVNSHIWLSPALVPVAVWIISYPGNAMVRFWIEGSYGVRPEASEISESLVFVILFLVCVGVAYRVFLGMSVKPTTIGPAENRELRLQEEILLHVTWLLVTACFIQRVYAGRLFGLYESFADLYHTPLEIAVDTIYDLRWFALAGVGLAYLRTRKKVFLIATILLFLSELSAALASTSKGAFLYLLVVALAVLNASGYRLPKWVTVTAGALSLIVLWILFAYTYRVRQIGVVRGIFDWETALRNFEVAADVVPMDVIRTYGGDVLERLIGYGDALIRMVRGETMPSDSRYVLGSLVEFGNLIPRFVWESRPHLSFNHYVTAAVWGNYSNFMEMPIGRVGEAFYVAGRLGFIYGVVYGILFAVMITSWNCLRATVTGTAMYIALLIAYFVPDAYLTYNIKNVIFLLMYVALMKLVVVEVLTPHVSRATREAEESKISDLASAVKMK